jgi:chaperonin GroEL (HSP60 family)
LEEGLGGMAENESERMGVKIVGEALKVPMRVIIENKIGRDGSGIIEKIKE